MSVKYELHTRRQLWLACSPHLISLRERIAVNNKPIGQDDFDSLVAASLGQAAAARGLQSVSHFEMMTAVAVKHFTSQKVPAETIEHCSQSRYISCTAGKAMHPMYESACMILGSAAAETDASCCWKFVIWYHLPGAAGGRCSHGSRFRRRPRRNQCIRSRADPGDSRDSYRRGAPGRIRSWLLQLQLFCTSNRAASVFGAVDNHYSV